MSIWDQAVTEKELRTPPGRKDPIARSKARSRHEGDTTSLKCKKKRNQALRFRDVLMRSNYKLGKKTVLPEFRALLAAEGTGAH